MIIFLLSLPPSNRQNDRLYVARSLRQLLPTCATFSQSLTVSVGVLSKLGCTELVLVDHGVKIKDVLLQKLLTAIRRVFGNMFTLQQDSASCTGHD